MLVESPLPIAPLRSFVFDLLRARPYSTPRFTKCWSRGWRALGQCWPAPATCVGAWQAHALRHVTQGAKDPRRVRTVSYPKLQYTRYLLDVILAAAVELVHVKVLKPHSRPPRTTRPW